MHSGSGKPPADSRSLSRTKDIMLSDVQVLNMLPLSPENRQALIGAVRTQHKERSRVPCMSQSLVLPMLDCPAESVVVDLPRQGSTPQMTIHESCLECRPAETSVETSSEVDEDPV